MVVVWLGWDGNDQLDSSSKLIKIRISGQHRNGGVWLGWDGNDPGAASSLSFPHMPPTLPIYRQVSKQQKTHRIKANISSSPSLSQSGSSTLSELPMTHFHLPRKPREKQKKMIRFFSWGVRQNCSHPKYRIFMTLVPNWQLENKLWLRLVLSGYCISFQIVPTCMISLTLNPEKIKSTTTDCFIFTDLFIQTRPRPAFGRLGLGG